MSTAPPTPTLGAPRDRLAAAAVALATALVFARAIGGEFVDLDDREYVVQNPWVNQGLSGEFWSRVWTTPVAANWHPLTVFSHTLDCQLFGLAPWGHHLTNVLLHAATAGVLVLAWRQLGLSLGVALAATLLWAWHPLRVESVAWVSERKDVLSGLLWAASLASYGLWVARPTLGRFGWLWCLYALAVLAKPSVVTLPCVLLLLDVWPLERCRLPGDLAPGRWRMLARLMVEKLPLAALSLGASVLTWLFQRSQGAFYQEFPWSSRVANALESVWNYLGQWAWPTELYIPYLLSGRTFTPLKTWFLAGALVAVTGAALAMARRWPWCPVGWGWYLGVLVPMIGLVQVGYQSMADRYTYLPHMGLCLALVATLAAVVERWPRLALARVGALAVLLTLWSGLTVRQIGFWQNSERLFHHTLMHDPGNYLAHVALGRVTLRRNDVAGAERAFQAALASEPADGDAHFGLGEVALRRSHFHEAVYFFERARRTPASEAYLAEALSLVGRVAEARAHYQVALELDPSLVASTANLGEAMLRGSDRTSEAIAAWERALETAPDDVLVLNRLAWVLATHPDDALRAPDRALRCALRACRLTDDSQPTMLDTLAAAQAATRQFAAANKTAAAAQALADVRAKQDPAWQAYAKQIAARRALFAARQAYREAPGSAPAAPLELPVRAP